MPADSIMFFAISVQITSSFVSFKTKILFVLSTRKSFSFERTSLSIKQTPSPSIPVSYSDFLKLKASYSGNKIV